VHLGGAWCAPPARAGRPPAGARARPPAPAPPPPQLGHHLRVALENGLSVEELSEAITHLAFYAGWPNAMTAITLLKQIADEQAAA
ncbi:carboxymuconolactone decarboxylase family protein, partial [Streptomyces sp. NPDC059010]|uniref:carboxymuconolactone decarboxylase family protein n=1 Tax=Streptomyces sp. NPDC059010 TaxID=3346695 RepID=UPI00369ACF9A